ncbi:acyl carrier protein [Paracraurococcus ruber]|uniref:Carrier domain-containing protein n=1 Tax=Paracraurococcus ruber TaxID=77675 RepID=A0ABS1D461_9PROT|nr:hypothetical protein [Paracraurococcus ruber]MBK1661336.1 hypothetical protein [Paracraurococcus ruber]TDG22556.1 hypothetical protein E2C05_26670 [Paracraurococcus ruber]
MTAAAFTLDELAAIAARVIGVRALALSPGMAAGEVPGWDSLNHTLIMLEVANARGIALGAEETAVLPDFAAVVALVNARLGPPPG